LHHRTQRAPDRVLRGVRSSAGDTALCAGRGCHVGGAGDRQTELAAPPPQRRLTAGYSGEIRGAGPVVEGVRGVLVTIGIGVPRTRTHGAPPMIWWSITARVPGRPCRRRGRPSKRGLSVGVVMMPRYVDGAGRCEPEAADRVRFRGGCSPVRRECAGVVGVLRPGRAVGADHRSTDNRGSCCCTRGGAALRV
jgi:hypothetical protein